MEINPTFPLWTVILTIIPFILGIIWALIKMFFNQKATHNRVTAVIEDMKHHENKVDNLKKDLENKLDRHKIANDNKLSEMNNTMIATKTLVELLVQDKIKK